MTPDQVLLELNTVIASLCSVRDRLLDDGITTNSPPALEASSVAEDDPDLTDLLGRARTTSTADESLDDFVNNLKF